MSHSRRVSTEHTERHGMRERRSTLTGSVVGMARGPRHSRVQLIASQERAAFAPRESTWRVHYQMSRGGTATLHLGTVELESGATQVVALKKMLNDDLRFSKAPGSLLREAQVGAHIRHPNVVPILQLCQVGQDPYLAMEYVVGVTLGDLVVPGEPLPLDISVAVIGDLLRGLHAVHTATDAANRPLQIIHRDVSPQNVVVGEDGVARLIDFGLAKGTFSEPTAVGVIPGKVGYLAPEQFLGETLESQVDLFTAGIVLWEALTGRRLFATDNPVEHMMDFLTRETPAASKYNAEVSPALDRIIERALSKAPNQRFESAEAFLNALFAAHPPADPIRVAAFVEQRASIALNIQRSLVYGLQVENRASPIVNPVLSEVARAELSEDEVSALEHTDPMDDEPTTVLGTKNLRLLRPVLASDPAQALSSDEAGLMEAKAQDSVAGAESVGVGPLYPAHETSAVQARPPLPTQGARQVEVMVPGTGQSLPAAQEGSADAGSRAVGTSDHRVAAGEASTSRVTDSRVTERPSASVSGPSSAETVSEPTRLSLLLAAAESELKGPLDILWRRRQQLVWLLPLCMLVPGLLGYAALGWSEGAAEPDRVVDTPVVVSVVDTPEQPSAGQEREAQIESRRVERNRRRLERRRAARAAARRRQRSNAESGATQAANRTQQENRRPAAKRRVANRKGASNCERAYYFDERGVKRIKLDCL